MKNIFYFLIILLFTSCANTKKVYWCGDHPCANERERKNYFKKTMIVEIRDYNKNKEKDSEFIKLQEKALADEKKRVKKNKSEKKIAKLEEKRKIAEEKKLTKQAKLEEKRRIKEEKKLAKQAKLEEKRRIKEEKKLAKLNKTEKNKDKKIRSNDDKKLIISSGMAKIEIGSNTLDKIIEKVRSKNMFRPYPDINDIPN